MPGPDSRDGLRALLEHREEVTRRYARRALDKLEADIAAREEAKRSGSD